MKTFLILLLVISQFANCQDIIIVNPAKIDTLAIIFSDSATMPVEDPIEMWEFKPHDIQYGRDMQLATPLFSIDSVNYDIYIQALTQEKTFLQKIPKPVKIIAVHLTAITLNAVSDAWIAQDKNRQWAHLLNAASIAVTLTGPWICDIEKRDWLNYIGSYITLRIGTFDVIYNLSRDLPWNYRHDASFWDMGVNQFNPPPGIEAFGRSVFVVISCSIAFDI